MNLIFAYSFLLLLGLAFSQVIQKTYLFMGVSLSFLIETSMMVCLSYIMIQVGREFRIDFKAWRNYKKDYGVAALAAFLPWLAVAIYFLMTSSSAFDEGKDGVAQALLLGRFAAPTSAGILFSMLVAAKLSKTWVFRKARILAIFDDLDTILFLIPLQLMFDWQRPEVYLEVLGMSLFFWLGAKRQNQIRIHTQPLWILLYSFILVVALNLLYLGTDAMLPGSGVHLEVLLPAFVIGMTLYQTALKEEHEQDEFKLEPLSILISCLFMVLVGFSMPNFAQALKYYSLWELALHIGLITLISNFFKCATLFFYKDEASFKERLAVSVAMFPRGEVGAAVIALSIGLGLPAGPILLATASLAFNLCLTGVFIYIVKRLIIAGRDDHQRVR
jgi:Kef-type K+ transport system membrane component KefB